MRWRRRRSPTARCCAAAGGKAAGFTLEWEEKPYEWILGRHFNVSRVFSKGPFRRFGPVFDLSDGGKGGSVFCQLNDCLDLGFPLLSIPRRVS